MRVRKKENNINRGEEMYKGLLAICMAILFISGCGATQAEVQEYPEYDTVMEYTEETKLDYDIQEDNSDVRVILWEDEKGTKLYKTVLDKETDRLKVMDLKSDEILFNK